MNALLTIPWTLLLLSALVAAVVATGRLIRDDRPPVPPGTPRDWRDEALDWNRLTIG